MRWIWIDNFVEFQPGKSARAVKNLSLAEDYFADHFPGYPIMPASLILEGLAQTGGILVGEANDFKEKVVLAKITSARFFGEALAGQRLTYDVELLVLRAEGASIRGKVTATEPAAKYRTGGDGVPAETLIAEAEIFFAHLDKSRSQQIFGDHNFVFTGELKNMLGLARLKANRAPEPSATP
jgi:3-hydroxyacyl-[acyl-carrier-protein] dehydratase